MGEAAEYIGEEYEVTREAMDRWALGSHQKAVAAVEGGKFEAEIIPLELPDGSGGPKVLKEDETPRRDTSLEKLAALKPSYHDDGLVTAGNASGLNDGEELGLTPMARVVGYSQAAVPPREMFIAPAHAIPKLLKRIGWTLEDVDLIELNEAFAAQVLADGYAMDELGWDWDKVNVNGGAIALGHPLGASGARILTTLLYALQDRKLSKGVASLCLGGGEAVAMAVELV